MTSSFAFLKLNIFIAWFLKNSQNLFMQCLISILLKEVIVDIEKPDGMCSLTFVVDEFFDID